MKRTPTMRSDAPIGTEGERSLGGIPRPEVSAAHIILLILAHRGPTSFKELMQQHSVHSLGTERTSNSFYTALARLKRRKAIIRTADRTYELTPAGEYAALKAYVRKEFTERERKLAAHRSQPTTSPKWDGKWRLILFDIPETRRPIRDYMRGVLKRIGCQEFQRSTWIYPYKLPPFIAKLMDDPQMRKYTRVITTYDIDYDEDLRKRFRLG